VSLTFENPWWLLVMLLALPVLYTGLRWLGGTMSRARAWSAVLLRTALLAIIASILAGASAVRTTDRLAVIALVDVSESVRQFTSRGSGGSVNGAPLESLRNWILAALRDPARRPDDLLGVVVFDGQAIAAATPRPIGPDDDVDPNAPVASGSARDFTLDWTISEGTNIGQALRLAGAMFPPDAARRLVLMSDGVETEGDALGAAEELSGGLLSATTDSLRRLAVDVLPLSYSVQNEVLVEAVDTPPQAASGSTVAVRVALQAPTTGVIELLYESTAIDLNGEAPGTGRKVSLTSGRNIVELTMPLDEGRTVHRMRPVFIPDRANDDRIASNNSAETFTVTPGKGRVLVVDGVGDARPSSGGLTLSRTLERAEIDVVTLSPSEAPIDVLSLQAYDLVILQNVAAEEIPRSAHKALADYVSELGGGLVMVGGPDSFGAGGWKGTDLEPVLPVKLDLPEQLLAPSAAVALVLDNSGSMSQRVMGGFKTQQEVANEGAALAIETLDRSDYVAVIAFNSMHTVVVPMERNTDAFASANRVRSIGTGGGTNLYPALEEAGRLLSSGEASKASVRHVIILSDGRSEGSAQEGIEIARRLKARGITVSSIAVGDGADGDTLAAIATEGGGQFYEVVDPYTLPRVFIREIRVVRKPLIRETPFRPVDMRSGSRLMAGVNGPIPLLQGLVLTQKRDDPKINYPLLTPEGEPVLAHWFVGRGQVAAFTSDAHHWAYGWLDWPGYSTLWTQIARTIARPASERSSELTTEIIDGELVIRLDASDDEGRPMDLLSVPGTVFLPDQTSRPVRLAQTGPGVYEARTPASERGNYLVALTPRQGERALPTVVGGASRALGEEFRALQSNVGLLRQIAELTGGRVLDLARPEDARLFERGDIPPARASSPIWRVLLVWAVVVFLLDVATRRVAWDRLLSREVAMALREQAASASRARSEKAAATVAALRSATTRGAAPEPGAPESNGIGGSAAEEGDRSIAARVRRLGKGEDDSGAARLKPVEVNADEQAERRRRLRLQSLERVAREKSTGASEPDAKGKGAPGGAGGSSVKGKGAPSGPDTPATPGDEESSTSGLLEAKRRARARFEKDKPGN
jgi:uncharacterized membrane protein